jgi:hypothetical protein
MWCSWAADRVDGGNTAARLAVSAREPDVLESAAVDVVVVAGGELACRGVQVVGADNDVSIVALLQTSGPQAGTAYGPGQFTRANVAL